MQRRLIFTLAVLGIVAAHLGWEFFQGGVRSHHLLARADMPSISNWWGLLLLPALTWFLVGRMQQREAKTPTKMILIFMAACVVGLALSIAFASGNQSLTEIIFQAMLLACILLPVFRAECVLGFVLGMMFTFGAILPMIVAAVLTGMSALVHLLLWPGIRRLWRKMSK